MSTRGSIETAGKSAVTIEASGSAAMERGLPLRTNICQWFVHRIIQLAGRPTHRCLKCINPLAWTCKQIHTWFYNTFALQCKLYCSEEPDMKVSDTDDDEDSDPEESPGAEHLLQNEDGCYPIARNHYGDNRQYQYNSSDNETEAEKCQMSS